MKPIFCLLLVVGLLFGIGCSTESLGPGENESGAFERPKQSTGALAPTANPNSPWRDASRDWRDYAQSYNASAGARALAAASVLNSKVAPSSANFANVPTWSDADIKMQFRATRDKRFMYTTSRPTFARRASWLYPDDGCYARSELAASMAADNGKPRPFKLFSFGNLAVQTNNSPSGQVTWWYHVVPVVKSATSGTVYVLDPAIEPSKPLEWQAWLLKQVPSLSNVQVTVADSNAYVPDSPVTGGANRRADALSEMQGNFLNLEWNRQTALGRDASSLLGENPPWGKERHYVVSIDPNLILFACSTCLGADALGPRCVADCP